MVRKRVVSIASLLVVIVFMAFIVIFNNQSLASANVVSSPVFAAENTTIIYESGMIYEDGNLGYLDVGYQGTFGVPLEAQVLLKFNLPTIPAGYEVETASLYLPVTGGTFQATTNFSLKVSTSTNHSWAQDSGITSPPDPTSGSTQSRLLSNNVPQLKPTLAPFNFTSYISRESAEPDPRATFILSGMTAQEAAEAGITHADHFIQMTENHAHDGSLGPYLIITYSEIVNIEITGVVDGGLYNTNPTPTFNIGTATLNGSPFTSGTQITAEGSYTLTVTAGSQSETIQFQIDKTPPTGTVIVNQGNQYTNSSSVLISISPDAGVTDITHIQYSINGTPFSEIPNVPVFLLSIGSNDGDKVLKFKLVDRAGNQSTEYQRTITRDTEVPTGSIVINNGNVYTTNREITLNLSLGNGVTDVVAVQFSNNNSSWSGVEAFSSIKSYTLPTGDGNKTVYVRLIDRAGNITVIHNSIILDTTAPTGTLTLITPSVTNATTVLLTVTSSNTDYMELGETGQDYGDSVVYSASPQSYTLQDTEEDGVKTLQIRLSDLAGNTTVLTQTVTLDREIPTGTVVVNEGKTYANDSDVAVEVTPAAGVTDIVNIRYSVNGSAPTTIAYTNNFTIDVGSIDGAKAIILQLIDGAGNESVEYSSTVTLDTVPPTGTVAINGGAAYATDREVTLGFTLGAGVTDVVAVQFSNDDATWSAEQTYEASMSYTLPAGDGSKTVYVRFIDRAGNMGSAEASIVLDTTAPIVTGVTDGESYNSSRTITFNEGTATLNGQNFISGSPVDAEGSYVLVVTDAAGNSITLAFTIIKYSVGYDGNGATEGAVPLDSQTYEAGSSVTVADNVGSLVKTGFTLIGWNTEADGSGKSYVANDAFHINEADVMLYAAWEINHYTLSFESNGGSLVALQNKPYNEQATEPTVPSRPGYSFGGWFKEAALLNQWNFTKDVITTDKTLYANWIINNSSNNNGGGSNPLPSQNLIPVPTPNPQPTPEEPKAEPEPPVVTFDDLSGHWAKGMIEELASQGIIAGYPDGSFHPNEHIKRHHMALLFTRAFKFEPIREAVSFSDVSPSHPYYEAIMSLQQAGIVDGANGAFNPNHSLTRSEMAKILTLAFEIKPGGTVAFQDVPTTHWSYDYIAALAELEIVLGDNGKFKPDEPVTRAQFVAMMYRALNVIQ